MRYYNILFVIGFVGWIIETAYFGFNREPINGYEAFFDMMFGVLMILGALGGFIIQAAKTVGNNIKIDINNNLIPGKGIGVEMEKRDGPAVGPAVFPDNIGEELAKMIERAMRADIERALSGDGTAGLPSRAEMEKKLGCSVGANHFPEGFRSHWEEAHCPDHKKHECGEKKEELKPVTLNKHKIAVRDENPKTPKKTPKKKNNQPKK